MRDCARHYNPVAEAQNSKPPIAESSIESVIFVPAVVMLSVITFFVWLFLGPAPQLSFALVTAMSVPIIASLRAGFSCTDVDYGGPVEPRSGLLVRNSKVLEPTAKLDLLVVDKTGTLTCGKPAVTSIHDLMLRRAQFLPVARSEHPLQMLSGSCEERSVAEAKLRNCESSRRGVSVRHGNMRVVLEGPPCYRISALN